MRDLAPVAVLGAFAVVAVAPILGLRRLALLVLLGALVVAPFAFPRTSDAVHVGIAPGEAVLTTYGAALILAFLVLPRRPPGDHVLNLLLPAAQCFFLIAGIFFFWSTTANQVSGVALLVLMALAVPAGRRLGEWVRQDDRHFGELAIVISLVLQVEFWICLAQVMGMPISIYPEVDQFVAEGRAIGTFNHPSVLGKFALLFVMVLLPLTVHRLRSVRRHAWLGTAAAILGTGLTESRANTLAILVAVVGWILLQSFGRLTLGRRLAILLTFSAAAIPAVIAAVRRYRDDPGGGDRDQLLRTGLDVISSNWSFGVGPNNYVEVVGSYDALAAAGYPVHNVYLLVAAELGLIGAVLLFLPVGIVLARGLRRWREVSDVRPWALAIVVTLPGLMVVTNTGWGMVSGNVAIAWFLVTGLLSSFIEHRSEPGSPGVRSQNSPMVTSSPPGVIEPSSQGMARHGIGTSAFL